MPPWAVPPQLSSAAVASAAVAEEPLPTHQVWQRRRPNSRRLRATLVRRGYFVFVVELALI